MSARRRDSGEGVRRRRGSRRRRSTVQEIAETVTDFLARVEPRYANTARQFADHGDQFGECASSRHGAAARRRVIHVRRVPLMLPSLRLSLFQVEQRRRDADDSESSSRWR